jgi:hypothetical protein
LCFSTIGIYAGTIASAQVYGIRQLSKTKIYQLHNGTDGDKVEQNRLILIVQIIKENSSNTSGFT